MRAGSKRLADAIVLDGRTGDVRIDGVTLPWWISVDPEVDMLDQPGVVTLRVGIMCEGVVTVINAGGDVETYDAKLGNVGDWAKDRVLQGLRERLPWLTA